MKKVNLFLAFGLALGIVLRVKHLFEFNFTAEPFRLGGLFLEFARQIAANGFRLPVTIPYYSAGGIPFAYPPLAFYIEALALRIFPNEWAVVNLLPVFLSILSLLAFIGLAQQWSALPWQQATAVLVFAIFPNAFVNQIEAGGLAESLGTLTLIGYASALLRVYRTPGWGRAVWAGLALGVCVLASPGSVIAAVFFSGYYAAAVLWQWRRQGRKIADLGSVLLVGGLGAAVSTLYWLPVMLRHGRGIFFFPVMAQYYVGSTEPYLTNLLTRLITFRFTLGNFSFLFDFFLVLGLFWTITRQKWLPLIGFMLCFSIPREYEWLIAAPAALLIAESGYSLFGASLQNLWAARSGLRDRLLAGILAGSVLLVMLYASLEYIDQMVTDTQWQLSAVQIRDLGTIQNQIPPDAEVIVFGNDAVVEWAPYLLERSVINTKFGLEWQPLELKDVTQLNLKIASAENWNDITQAANPLVDVKTVYIVSAQKSKITQLAQNSVESAIQFQVIAETPSVQLLTYGRPE